MPLIKNPVALELSLAWRYLTFKGGYFLLTSLIAFLGIALGVATLIITTAVMNGFRAEMSDKILGVNGHIILYTSDPSLAPFVQQQIKEVKAAIPLLEGQVLLQYGARSQGGIVKGIELKDLLLLGKIKTRAGSLDYLDPQIEGGSVNKIAIGTPLAFALGAKVGKMLTIVSADGPQTIFGKLPRLKQFEVAAIADLGMYDYDSSFAYLPLQQAQKFFGDRSGEINKIILFIDQIDRSPEVVKLLRTILPKTVRIVDWQQESSAYFEALNTEKRVMFLILSLIIVMSGFNIITSLVVLAQDKIKGIAILRTIGLKRGAILRIFCYCGMILGAAGTTCGAVLGIAISSYLSEIQTLIERVLNINLFSPSVYLISHLPSKLVGSEVIKIILMSLALSLGSALPPAFKAASSNPAETLKQE